MSDFKNEGLKKAFHQCVDELGRRWLEFPWQDKEAYTYWLGQTYYFVRHTTSFLSLAASRFGHKQRERHYSMLGHIQDELHHDKLALDDLKALGRDIKDVPELVETSAFYQTQYYFIEHEDPASLFGYALCLEGLASKLGTEVFEMALKHHGPKATRFLKVHSVVDKDHFDHGLENFKDISDEEAEVIRKNLVQSARIYTLILDEIENRTVKKKNRNKAA